MSTGTKRKNPAPYFYTRSGTRWTAGAWVKAANADAGDEFGSSSGTEHRRARDGGRCPWRGQRGDRNQRQSGRQFGRRFRSCACVFVYWPWRSLEASTPTPNYNSQQVSGRGSSNLGVGVNWGAILLLTSGHAFSQGQPRPAIPALPLKQIAYIKASNAEAYDYFADGGGNPGHNGNSIALSGDGSTMVVGAPYEQRLERRQRKPERQFSLRVRRCAMFARQGSSWVQQVLCSRTSNADQSDHFGASVALSRDGNTLAVAAPWESSAATGIDGDQNDNSLRQAGAVRLQSRGKHVDAAGVHQSLEHRKGRRRRRAR